MTMPRAKRPLRAEEAQAATRKVLAVLVRDGLLLKQDKQLASVVTLMAGEPLSASWWSHPESRMMFRVLSELADHPDVLTTKLLAGKDTFVHRSLWPALLAVATGGEPWQSHGLTGSALGLLARTKRASAPVRSSGAPVSELRSRLLLHAEERHTATGRHELVLRSWKSWAARTSTVPLGSAASGRARLEAACDRIGAPRSLLPWPATRLARSEGAGPA